MIQLGIADIKPGWIRKLFGGGNVFILKAGHLPNLHSVNPNQGCLERECQRGNVLALNKVLEWFVIRKWSSIVGLNAGCAHPHGAGTAHSKRTKPLLTARIICSLLKRDIHMTYVNICA